MDCHLRKYSDFRRKLDLINHQAYLCIYIFIFLTLYNFKTFIFYILHFYFVIYKIKNGCLI